MPAFVRAVRLEELAEALGGSTASSSPAASLAITGVEAPRFAGRGHVCPVLRLSAVADARAARERGAILLVDQTLAPRLEGDWVHEAASWAMAGLLDRCESQLGPPVIGDGAEVHPTAVLFPGVRIGARARIEAYAVVGARGFGFATSKEGRTRVIPHLGGVVVGDDADIGAHVTVHAGVLSPTRVGHRTKLDAHVHVGHNCEIGDDCFVAAQSGFAGSVVLGNGVLVGGQAGIADHVVVGDGARIAAKSGVIGDVPAKSTVGGYPALPRGRWLRGIAMLETLARKRARRD